MDMKQNYENFESIVTVKLTLLRISGFTQGEKSKWLSCKDEIV